MRLSRGEIVALPAGVVLAVLLLCGLGLPAILAGVAAADRAGDPRWAMLTLPAAVLLIALLLSIACQHGRARLVVAVLALLLSCGLAMAGDEGRGVRDHLAPIVAGAVLLLLGINGVRRVARTPGGALVSIICIIAGIVMAIGGMAAAAWAGEAVPAAVVPGHDPFWALPLFVSLLALFWATCATKPAARLRGLVAALMVLLIWLLMFAVLLGPAAARDDGRFAGSPHKDWFDTLRSGKGPCCSDADGTAVSDVDWDSAGGHYRVRLDDEWIVVPDDALVTEPNRVGRAMVWPFRRDGKVEFIRCFMPGSMT